MARVIHDNTRVVREADDFDDSQTSRGLSFVAKIVYLFSGLVIGLLAIRFILVLLGANPSNAFADFIFDVSQPFVAPFFGLFNYSPTYLNSRFEFETLIAMAVYAIITWIILQALSLGYHDDTV